MQQVAEPRAVVIDTNVVLDLLVFKDPATTALRAELQAGAVTWLATPAMRDELERVLGYPKLAARIAFHQRHPSAVLAAMVWAAENPNEGWVESDEMDHERCLQVQRPYLGRIECSINHRDKILNSLIVHPVRNLFVLVSMHFSFLQHGLQSMEL